MKRRIHHLESWGQTLPSCYRLLFTAVLVLISMACTADVPVETSSVQEAVHTRTAADEARIVETLVQRRYADYRATLTSADTVREDAREARAGASGTHLFVQWSSRQTVKSLWAYRMRIPTSAPVGASDSDRAARFLQDHRALFGVNPSVALSVRSARFDASLPGTIVRYDQQLLGRPVFGASLLVHVGRAGDIEYVTGHIVPEAAVSATVAVLTAADAARLTSGDAATGVLGWFDPEVVGGSAGPVRLTWRVRAGSGVSLAHVFIDAVTGAELARRSLVRADQHKEIFFDDGTFGPPTYGTGALQLDDQCHTSGDATCPPGWCSGGICKNPAPLGTSEAVQERTEVVYDYLFDRFGRDSWDDGQCGTPGHGCTDASLHRMRALSDHGGAGTCISRWFNYDDPNNPAQIAMAVGHGNSLDAIAHEWIHGVANSTEPAPFGGGLQAASMGEGLPDVIAQLTESYSAGTSDWIQPTGIGGPPCSVLANLANPPALMAFCRPPTVLRAAPGHWSNFRYDCPVAHFNRTVAGKIGHLMGREPSEGTEVHWGVPVEGIGEVAASTVWYKVLTGGLASTTTHTELRNALYDMCGSLDPDLHAGCIGSVDAVGLWSSDTDVGWDVDGAVAAQYFRTSGVDRRWVFYKEPGVNEVRYRYRTCWLFDSCTWSSPVVLDPGSSGPAATVYNSRLWICFRNPSGGIWCDRIDSTGYKDYRDPPAGTMADGPPSLVQYGGALYLGYQRSGTFRWMRWTTAGGWEAENVEWAIGAEPALASPDEDIVPAGGPLWVVYRRTGDSRLAYRSFDSATSTWNAEVLAGPPDLATPPTALDRPSAVVHKGRLHAAARQSCGTYGAPCSGNPIYYMSCDLPCTAATDWTRWVPQDGTWSSQPYFHLENQGDVDARLYLWHRPTGSSNLSWRHKSSE